MFTILWIDLDQLIFMIKLSIEIDMTKFQKIKDIIKVPSYKQMLLLNNKKSTTIHDFYRDEIIYSDFDFKNYP